MQLSLDSDSARLTAKHRFSRRYVLASVMALVTISMACRQVKRLCPAFLQISSYKTVHAGLELPYRASTLAGTILQAGIRSRTSHASSLQDEAAIRAEVDGMRARDMKRELEEAGMNVADLFEKDELAARLLDFRLRGAAAEKKAGSESNRQSSSPPSDDSPTGMGLSMSKERLRTLSVKELRTQLGERGIPWADAFDKDELVSRLLEVVEQESAFSRTGKLRPGIVNQVTGAELEQELKGHSTPLLLDVFATWCGPCQFMAPHFSAVAKKLGNRVRVVKIDSDAEPTMASYLRVGGLPTVLLFDRRGNEVRRQEGAMVESQLMKMVESVLSAN